MSVNCFLSVFVSLWCAVLVKPAKILAIFPSPGYSQYFVGEPLLIDLAQRGHEITLVSFHKPKKPVRNIKTIQVAGLRPFHEGKMGFALNEIR